MPDLEEVADKAEERVSLRRGELWLLRVAAVSGVVAMISHVVDVLHDLGVL